MKSHDNPIMIIPWDYDGIVSMMNSNSGLIAFFLHETNLGKGHQLQSTCNVHMVHACPCYMCLQCCRVPPDDYPFDLYSNT